MSYTPTSPDKWSALEERLRKRANKCHERAMDLLDKAKDENDEAFIEAMEHFAACDAYVIAAYDIQRTANRHNCTH